MHPAEAGINAGAACLVLSLMVDVLGVYYFDVIACVG